LHLFGLQSASTTRKKKAPAVIRRGIAPGPVRDLLGAAPAAHALSAIIEATVNPITFPVEPAIRAISALIQASVKPFSLVVETSIDAISASIQASVKPIAFSIQPI